MHLTENQKTKKKWKENPERSKRESRSGVLALENENELYRGEDSAEAWSSDSFCGGALTHFTRRRPDFSGWKFATLLPSSRQCSAAGRTGSVSLLPIGLYVLALAIHRATFHALLGTPDTRNSSQSGSTRLKKITRRNEEPRRRGENKYGKKRRHAEV